MLEEQRHGQAQGDDGHRHPDQPAATADAVGRHPRQAGGSAKHHGTDHQDAREGVGRNAQPHGMARRRQGGRRFGIHLHEGRHHVEQHIGGHHDERALHDGLPELHHHFLHRCVERLLAMLGLTVHVALVQTQPHVQAHPHHQQRGNERNAPGPFDQRLGAEPGTHPKEGPIGQQQPQRCTQLREGTKPGPLAIRGVLGGHQGGTAPFAPQAQPLPHPEHAQQNGRPDADALVVGQQADGHRGQAHQQQRGHQCLLAADLVAEVTEQHGTERAGKEGQRQRGHRQQDGDVVIALVEELGVEDQHRRGCVDVVVVKLDGRAHHRGNGHLVRIVAQVKCRLRMRSGRVGSSRRPGSRMCVVHDEGTGYRTDGRTRPRTCHLRGRHAATGGTSCRETPEEGSTARCLLVS